MGEQEGYETGILRRLKLVNLIKFSRVFENVIISLKFFLQQIDKRHS